MSRRFINKVFGITKAKRKISKLTGIPTSRSGRQAKMGRALGCGLLVLAIGLTAMVSAVAASLL